MFEYHIQIGHISCPTDIIISRLIPPRRQYKTETSSLNSVQIIFGSSRQERYIHQHSVNRPVWKFSSHYKPIVSH